MHGGGGKAEIAFETEVATSVEVIYQFTDQSLQGPVPGIPEPSTWAMLLVGFAGLGFASRHRHRVGGVIV